MAENSMKPRIRFKGYTDAWEQRKLGELGFFKSNGVDKKINPNEVFVNLLNYMDVYNRRHITAKNCVELMQVTAKPQQVKDNDIQANDIFFTPTSETADDIGHVLVIEETLPNTVYSYHLMRYRPFDGKFYPTFPNYEFESGFVRYQIVLNAQGVQRFVLNREAFEQLEIRKPDYAEQEKISKFLSQLDNMSVLYQQKHDKILNIKKALLEKMFPSDTETTPKIRFKGVNDAWEQRKIGDLGVTYAGLSGKKKEDFGHGEAEFIPYLNVFTNPIADVTMTEAIEIDDRQVKVQNGDVLFTTSSETPEEVGMSSVWLKNSSNTYLNSFCFGFRLNESINSYYLAYMLRSKDVRNKIVLLAQGISRYNISKKKMMEINVPIPTDAEQRKVGEIFKQLDNLINLYRQQIEKLKNIKTALLEKMFV